MADAGCQGYNGGRERRRRRGVEPRCHPPSDAVQGSGVDSCAGPGTSRRRPGKTRWGAYLLLLLAYPLSLAAAPGSATAGEPASAPYRGTAVHVVGHGQTLFGIARAYGVPLAALIEANRLRSPNAIAVGQRLLIPGVRAPVAVAPRRPLSQSERRDLLSSFGEARDPVEPPRGWAPPAPAGPGEFVWPLVGPVNSSFGPRGKRLHTGIDIGSPSTQQVGAAADGEVSLAQPTRTGLGNVVVLEHMGGFGTVYAHLAVIIAREGESVRQGQPVGGAGATGNATGPHLHFEIRHRGVPVDPLRHLPQTLDDLVKDLGKGRR